MFSNQGVNAQGSAAIFQTDAATNFLKISVPDISQNDLCFELTTNQISYKSHLGTRDEKSEFIAMNRKYYGKDAEINRALPVVLNSSLGYYTFSQDSSKYLETKEFYLHKSKTQNTTGWILVGAGTFMILFPIWDYYYGWNWGPSAASIAMTMFAAGTLSDIIGIGFFISAHHNKKMATTLSFDNQTIYSPLDKSCSHNVVPSLTLRIRL